MKEAMKYFALVLLAVMAFPTPAHAQTHLPEPFNMGSMNVDKCTDNNQVVATLQPILSWVPYRGGHLRYRVTVSMARLKVSPGITDERALACYISLKAQSYSLRLKDQSGFLLETIPLNFRLHSVDNGNVDGLVAEGDIEMHADEYAQLSHDDYSLIY